MHDLRANKLIKKKIYFYTQWCRVCTYTFMENAGKKMQVQIILDNSSGPILNVLNRYRTGTGAPL
jgi:hypothetical protein